MHHLDTDRQLIVEVNTSEKEVEAMLSQRSGDKPNLFHAAFFYKKLTIAECNYDVGNCELLAIKLMLEQSLAGRFVTTIHITQ